MTGYLPASAVYAGASAAAFEAWQQRDPDVGSSERIERVADLVWGYVYSAAYSGAYQEAAQRLRAAAQGYADDLGAMPHEARVTLVRLAEAALATAGGTPVAPGSTMDSTTLERARQAATQDRDSSPHLRPVIRVAWEDASRRGAAHGVLHASRHILAGWNGTTTAAEREFRLQGFNTITGWAHETMARINREVVNLWSCDSQAEPALIARTSFAAAAAATAGPEPVRVENAPLAAAATTRTAGARHP